MIQPDAKRIEVIIAWRVRISPKQCDQQASHRDEHRSLGFPHQGAAEGINIKAFGPRQIGDSQTQMAPAVGAQLRRGFLSSFACAGTFCMRAEYLLQSKHWRSAVYHEHLLASKTTSPG
jgi:hypothetical protein